MELVVSYFALYREVAGCDTETVRSEAQTPRQLFAERVRCHGGLERFEASLVAVNDAMVSWDCQLVDGDRVLFFPPVAGG